MGRRPDQLEKRLLKELLAGIPQTNTVLEVGCGTGHFTRWFVDQGLRAVGLDLSPAMLAEAITLAEAVTLDGLSWVQADGLALPFPDTAFDVVALITTLEFVPAPARALREALRVARRALLLGVLNRHSLLGWQAGLMRAMAILGEVAPIVTPAEGTFALSTDMSVEAAIVEVIRRHPIRETKLVETLRRIDMLADEVQVTLAALEAGGEARRHRYRGELFWEYAGGTFGAAKEPSEQQHGHARHER